MPDLPEVETLRHDLSKEIVGRRIKRIDVRLPRLVTADQTRRDVAGQVAGRTVGSVGRRGIHVACVLDGGVALVLHLGPVGRAIRERSAAPVERRTGAIVTFTTGGDLRLVDLREPATIFVTATAELATHPAFQPSAIDPLELSFTWQAFSARVASRAARLKTLLTDERVIVGLGDIYSDEVLWLAGLRWDRASDGLSAQEVRRLYRAIQEVVHEAVRLRGTSLADNGYVDVHGNKGEFQAQLNVVQREGLPCRRCRTSLVVETAGAGVTYLCPQCQS